jgi:acetyltransferase-like isoleucine patch superfamily enzyme
VRRLLERAVSADRLIAGRLRLLSLRLRGMRSGAKSTIGPRLAVRRPWCIALGARVEIEQDVFLKVVDDAAVLAIGDFTFIGRGCEIDVALSVTIGRHVLLAPNVFVTDHTHNHARAARLDEQGIASAAVSIGDDAWIGTGAVILAGITIGSGAIVGAGAVVTRNVDPYSIVAGVPARVVGERR